MDRVEITRRCFLGAAGASFVPLAFSAESDYPSRNIDFIIPKAPGGGFDSLVRMIAPPLERNLPHKVNVIPDNVPAGGGGKGITQLYRSKPDGYTLGAVDIPGTFILEAKQGGGGFSLEKMTWLCSLGKPEQMCLAVGQNSPLKTFDDLKKLSEKRALKFTSSGPEGTAYAATLVGTAMLGLKAQLITGYKGSSDYVVGAIRGDGDAVIAPVSSVRPLQKSNSLRVLASFEPRSTFPGAPDATAMGRPDLAKIVLERMVAAPPGLPAKTKGILASALEKALSDPQAVSLAKKIDIELTPSTPEEAAARILESSSFFSQWKKYFLA
jgi:tripartite-type tricarboxylate transporter receptor subunit TctC